MRDEDELLAVAEAGLRAAKDAGAEMAECYVATSEGTAINLTGDFALPKDSIDEGVAIRVAVGSRLGQSGASGLGERTLRSVARYAVEAARHVPADSHFRRFAQPLGQPARPTQVDARILDPDPERLVQAVEAAAAPLVRARDVTYRGVSLNSWRTLFAVANTEGMRAWDRGGAERLAAEARVTRGTTERSAQDMIYAREPIGGAADTAALAQSVIDRARAAIDSGMLERAVDEVILHQGPAAQLVQLFTPALSGRRVRARQTPLADRLGEVVASESLTLRDAPHGPDGVQHQRVDHEGVPTAPLTLLDAGRVSAFLHDSQSALLNDCAPTGHGLRTGVSGGVGIRAVNLDLAPGDQTLEELVEGAERAVLVNEPLMGGFVANEVTGDFSLVAPFAFLVEKGRVVRALPPTTVGGNVHRALREVRALSRERRVYGPGTFPAMRIGGVSCAS